MEKENILEWSKDKKLTWSDFWAESNPSEFADSLSKIKYHHTWTVKSEMLESTIYYFIENIQLQTQFLKHLSWVREQNTSEALLNHEQGHFDLAESFRHVIEKEMENKFKGKKYLTRGKNDEQKKQLAKEDSGLMISKELEKWHEQLKLRRQRYDEETEFGLNMDKQKEYDQKFSSLRD